MATVPNMYDSWHSIHGSGGIPRKEAFTATSGPRDEGQRKGQTVVRLGIASIVLQVVALIINIVGAALPNPNGVMYIFAAGWCGVWIFIGAALAISSGRNGKQRLLNAALAMLIIGSVFAFTMFGFSVASIVMDHSYRGEGSVPVSALLLVISLAQVVITIWMSALTCRVVCDHNGSMSQGEQEMIFLQHKPESQSTIHDKAKRSREYTPSKLAYSPETRPQPRSERT